MAAKKKVNKTQLILDALAKNPEASPMEIAEKLKAYKISAAYVSNIKFTKKAAKTKRQPGRGRRGSSRGAAGDNVSVASLMKAKRLADELGGVERAKTLLDALSKLTG